MFNRIILYVGKNFGKMISTFLMFVVMLSLIGTLGYVFATVNNRVSEVKVVRHNYVVDYDQLFGSEQSYDEEESEEEYVQEEKTFKSYKELYEKALSLDGLTAYKVDSAAASFVFADAQNTGGEEFFDAGLNIQIADDERHIDFVTGKVEMLYGSLGNSGIVISEEMASNNGIEVGDNIAISSYVLQDYGDGDYEDYIFDNETEIEYVYKYDVEVVGIYRSIKQESNNEFTMFMGESAYISLDMYDELSTVIRSEESKYELKIYGESFDNYSGYPDFERVLAQYDNEKSAKELDKYVEEEYDFLYIVDSGKEIEKAKEPLGTFNLIVLITLIVAILISMIGIYLNMFLKLDKRRSEFISLLACGINSFKLSIQVFLEQLLFLLLSIPFAYLLVKAISSTVLEIVKMYYIVVIEENLVENDEFFGSWLEYINVNAADVVEFTTANLTIVIGSVSAIMFVSLLLLSVVEVMRRYKNVKKV